MNPAANLQRHPPMAQTVKQTAGVVLANAQKNVAPASKSVAPVPAKVAAPVPSSTDKYKMLKVSAGVIAISAICFFAFRHYKA